MLARITIGSDEIIRVPVDHPYQLTIESKHTSYGTTIYKIIVKFQGLARIHLAQTTKVSQARSHLAEVEEKIDEAYKSARASSGLY